MLRVVGRDAALAGEVGADAAQRRGSGSAEHRRDDAVEVAGHDALAEVAELDHEHDAVASALPRAAAADSCSRTSSSVLRLTSACATTRSTWLEHRRADQRHRRRRRRRGAARSMFSMRESPMRRHAGRAAARGPTSGEPSVALVTPVTEMPRSAEALDERAGVVADPVEVDLEPRRAHVARGGQPRLELGERAGPPCRPGGPADRVSASVAGMPSSSS